MDASVLARRSGISKQDEVRTQEIVKKALHPFVLEEGDGMKEKGVEMQREG